MAWFQENEPEIGAKTANFFVVPDYLIFHMTGQRVTDHTYGSRSMLMDLRQRQWSEELLTLFGVEKEKLCSLIPPSSVAGRVTEQFAATTGLTPGIPVITSGGDQQCGALGQGVFAPGTASVNLGTGAYLIASTPTVPEPLKWGLICNASAIPDAYILESSVLTCGAALDWFLRELGPDCDVSLVGKALRTSPPGANGVIALPYFQGRANPDWNSSARAAFFGMEIGTSRLDLLRALLESICIEVGENLCHMEEDQPLTVLCVSGGLSQTPEVCQLLADVTGKMVTAAPGGDATTRGAWMSAVHCLGLVDSWEAAWERIRPRESRTFQPDTRLASQYREISEEMERLYQSIQNRE
jgi:sugar (pentulose or hexulose) kinase